MAARETLATIVGEELAAAWDAAKKIDDDETRYAVKSAITSILVGVKIRTTPRQGDAIYRLFLED